MSPPKTVSRAASSSVWNGCGSNSRANARIASLPIARLPSSITSPGVKSSQYRTVMTELRVGGIGHLPLAAARCPGGARGPRIELLKGVAERLPAQALDGLGAVDLRPGRRRSCGLRRGLGGGLLGRRLRRLLGG